MPVVFLLPFTPTDRNATVGSDRTILATTGLKARSAVISDKDQVNMQLENTVSTVSKVVVFFHRTNYTMGMQRLQAFKYELMPNGEQQRNMRRFAGACRFVFNKALALQQANHEAGGKFISYVAMAKQLTAWRNGSETP